MDELFLPLIVPTFCGNAFYIFLMRQFFRVRAYGTIRKRED